MNKFHASSGRCKTCGAAARGSHCGEHMLQLQRFVDGDASEPDAPDVYQPRLDGIRGLKNGGTARARRGMRRPRTGEELNFDGE
jgi:hypothetical protein